VKKKLDATIGGEANGSHSQTAIHQQAYRGYTPEEHPHKNQNQNDDGNDHQSHF